LAEKQLDALAGQPWRFAIQRVWVIPYLGRKKGKGHGPSRKPPWRAQSSISLRSVKKEREHRKNLAQRERGKIQRRNREDIDKKTKVV